MMIRNVAIVLGPMCDSPVQCVLGWTPNGAGEGGTGHTYCVARAHNIPVFDLALLRDQLKASEFIYDATSEYWEIAW